MEVWSCLKANNIELWTIDHLNGVKTWHKTLNSSIFFFRQNATTKAGASGDSASAGAAAVLSPRSKPLENKKSSNKPLQKVAPHYVKKVVAEVESSIEQIEVN